MANIRNIVVATDFSEASDAAVERAVQLAVVHGAALCLLHAIDDTARPAPESAPDAQPGASAQPPDDQLRQRLAAIAASLAGQVPVEVTIHCEAGPPATVIAAYVRTHDCSLVVAGSRADPALSGLGSTASQVVQMPACPTLIVRATERRPYATILSAVDLRDGSLRAAALAIDLFAQAHHHLLYALDPVLPDSPESGAQADEHLQSEYDSLRSQADLDLRQLAQRLSRLTVHPVKAIVADDVPARAILVSAATLRADCVVVGHHGDEAATDKSLGSMAQHVIHSALSDVLVVP
ncbi:universal stress protein [Piscinibacter sp.]|uniref:universal stress protein n=1 Tax=Piscinibacter sp. TaxID=1903157 RepID=UPI002CFE61A3|nr:universal stress protein [Albitalea sp.]HUG25265.1 universal stress protein [Albitalea sp.]